MDKKKKILIVEDDVNLMKVLSKRLEHHEFQVLQARSGYEGLYCYLREIPDLIILDIMMPGLDGFEVCREIRRNCMDMATPIVMLTAKGDDYDRIKGRVIGATKYLAKPYDISNLMEEVQALLDERQNSDFSI